MNVLSSLRSFMRPERVVRGLLGLALVMVAWACADKVVGPTPITPKGHIGVWADLGPNGITTLVIQASGPGIVKPDGSLDTLAFNIPLQNGVASGSLDIPAGPDRVITARAFVGVTETHRGSVTTNILEGTNPTLHITMVPLVGNLPITVSIGSTIVIVRPLVASKAVGDTLQLTSEIRDYNGTLVNAKVRWATLNPNKATVDTNGLVTVKDTGDVQVVGTYGTVGGASKISGVAVASVAAIHLTWNGSVSTNWAEPNNWTPHGLGAARVPTLADSVVIPAGAPRMPVLQCVDNNAVRDIVIPAGAQLTSSCYRLNVYGSAVVHGPIPTINARPSARLAGEFGDIYIVGAGVQLIDTVTAGYVSVEQALGTFSLNQHKLRTTGDFNVSNGATVTMLAGDTLIVGSNVAWQGGDHTGLITGGVVFIRGTQFYGPRYFGTGTSRLVLDRTGSTRTTLSGFDYVNNPNNSRIRRLEIKSRDGATLCGYVRVTDTLSLTSVTTPSSLDRCSSYYLRVDGPIITTANTDVDVYLMDIRHSTGTSLVAGTWQTDYTDLNTANVTLKPTLAYENLRFFASNTLPANMAISGHLYLDGAGVELNLGGRKLTVGNYLETQHGATLRMENAGDSLMVSEYGYFPHDFHALQKSKLTNGVISIGAYLYGFGFASSGTKLVMSGTSSSTSKYISGMNYESRPAQELYDLEYSGSTYGVCERTKVAHNVVVKAATTVNDASCGSGYLLVVGDLTTEATSTVSPYLVALNNIIGTSHVSGVWSPQHTDFNVPNAVVKPGLAYGNMRFFASTQLTGTTTATGYVYVNGNGVDLRINGQTLNVGNYLQFDNLGTLTMDNASDVVNVTNYGYFNTNSSAAEETKLTAGVLSIGEYLYGFGFSASGTHKLVMTGVNSTSTSRYISGMNYESRPTQGAQNLEIAAGKTYSACERLLVKGTLTVRSGATFDSNACGQSYLRIDGDVVSEATSVISPYNVALYTSFGTQHVDGSFSPDYTSVHTTAAAGQLKAGVGYKSLQFFTPVSLPANLTVNGELNVSGSGAALTLNGKTLTVNGNLNVTSNGIIVMNNAADSLDVSGNVSWSGSGNEVGQLTNGKAVFRGLTFCGSKYETSVAHKTIFQRATSDAVRFQCVSSSSTSQLMYNVDVKGSGVVLECAMNVSNDIRVYPGATLSMSNSCNSTLYVGHDLISDATSTITNGSNYPASGQLTISLANATGTQHVLGDYTVYYTVFSAVNAYIQPTLTSRMDYDHVRIDQSTTFQDSTEIDGGLELINSAIVDLNGHTVVVRGSMDFNNSSRLKMVQESDTLVVGYGDPAADLLWDGADNQMDASNNLLLTAGAVKFYGDRFYGLQYKPTVTGIKHHRFIFMSPASGNVSLEGNPSFAVLEIRTPRPIVNTTGLAVVKDSLVMGASTTFASGHPSYQVQVLGDLIMAAGSDLSVAAIYLDGANGTSLVNGGFHPSLAAFRSPTPIAGAIKPGLQYQSLLISTGAYQLSGATSLAGSIDILNGGKLTINGQTFTIAGYLAFGTNGGGLVMSNNSDVVTVGGTFQMNSPQANSVLTAGTATVSGDYNIFDNYSASGTYKAVLAGSASKNVNANGCGRAFQDLDITGTGAVNFQSGICVNGDFRIQSTATVTGSTSSTSVLGDLTTASGSSFTATNLNLYGLAGTNLVSGNLTVPGTIFFGGSSQTIKVGAGFSYANMSVSSIATVSGGGLSVPGTLTVAGTLGVPSSSTLGTVNVNSGGTLNFLGSSLSTGTLTINSGGTTTATNDFTPTVFVDFNRIQLNASGVLNNGLSRSSGQGGFRYKNGGGFQKSGTVVGPDPIGQP